MLKLLGLQKFGVICGFVLPFVAFGCIGIAIVSYPEFSWTNNALSDLGVVPGVTAFAFNFGLFAAGVLGFFFVASGLFSYFKNTAVGKLGVAVFALATVWLMAIGVFNESFYPAHFVVSVLFFITMPVAFWVLAVTLYLKHEVSLAIFTLFSSVVAAAPWILYFIMRYVPNVAVPEAISALISSIWVIILSYKMLKATKPQ
jgi:hypothetical membrane protein